MSAPALLTHRSPPWRPTTNRQWGIGTGIYDAVIRAHGTPEQAPAFWRGASTLPYFDRIEAPVLIHHGELDADCKPEWTRRTTSAMRAAGVDVAVHWYLVEGQTLGPQFDLSMERTLDFLEQELT